MESEYITAADAATTLRVTTRQVNRYGNDGRIATQKIGRRVLYLKSDVEKLAEEIGAAHRPQIALQRIELVQAGEMINYLRERDRQIEELHQQLHAAAAEIGRLTGIIEQQR